ncbi:hypothetical protein Poli38472_002399 [Pythium oligandrum]|uniref:tubulin-glutamate carboxypeptidase n=1 Tax=Pythium oligandrum TaxID=41045 RepID=A0A8K1CJ94_PYTOL|nr:hypothetical protein Poli38472_002399 [Pythium oligandrum]|eukprot:TMW63458.1 hypothetical protein Poli38472_002399 [Pythium oligandrum]
MSSVQVLLSGLQDPRRTTAEGFRTTLLDLLTICRYDEPKAELIRSGGLDILAEFVATEILAASAFVDVMDVVLELVLVLVTENTHLGKTRIVERPPLLTLPLHCIRLYSQRKSSKKRNKLFRMALELLDVISFTEMSRRTAHSEQVILTLLRVMENPEEEPCLLLIVTEMLVCYLEGNSTGIHFAAKYNAITILLRLVTTPSERQDAKRSALEALLVIADVKDLIPIIMANNAVHAVGGCLRGRCSSSCHRTEYAALRLLLRLAEHSQIYGQMVNEEMIPWLFQLIERHTPHHLDIIKVACSLLDGIAAFAHSCKLDLSPFIYKGPPCRGLVLVQAANEHGHEPSLVASVFRFFVHVARNPVELPMVLNSETIEGLLSLYVHSSGTTSSYRAEISTYLVRFVTLLSRSTIETITLKNEDLSLPALFLCLRSHTSDLQFASQVFAIVSKNWRARSTPPRSAHSIAGFVAIAVQLLRDHTHITAHSHWMELMELYNFLREVLVSTDGGQVVLACGGKVLHAVLQERSDGSQSSLQLRPTSENASGGYGDVQGRAAVKGMIAIVLKMLGDVISTADLAVTDSSKDSMRGESRESRRLRSQYSGRFHNGEVQYSSYIEDVMRRERSCVFRPATADPGMDLDEVGSMVDEEDDSLDGENEAGCQQFDDDSGEYGEPGDVSGEIEEEDDIVVEGNDDDSDGAEDTEQVVLASTPAQNSLAQLTQRDSSPTPRDGSSAAIADPVAAECLPRHLILPDKELKSIDYVELEERPFFYVDHQNGIQYPRHPYQARHSASSSSSSSSAARSKSAAQPLVDESPANLEPSRAPDPARLASFVEQATLRRQQFINADPSVRARMVYENAAVYEAGGADSATRGHLTGRVCQLQHLYSVPETTKAFAQAPVLTFDSHFESGNLEQAIQIGEYEYDLVLRRDLHTTGNMQWFYFAVSNIPSAAPPGGTKYRFNIINLCKPDSLFNQGLQPVLYSVKDAQRRGICWRRSGEDIYYFPNPFIRPCKNHSSNTKATDPATDNQGNDGDSGPKTESTSSGGFYTLTFTLTFENPGDTYLIAHSYPYTFTDHQRHLAHILQAQRTSGRRSPQILRHNVLCSTVSGRPCDVLTITDFSVGNAELRSRKAIILTARVHPGEAQASWIMRGIIDFLLSNSDAARVLRRLFVFTIVPMLNPDGVFYGNSRCSLSACDLNRQWHQPSQDAHPTIYHTKELIRREFSSRGIVFFCDIHGHSRKKNVFMYGCDTKKRPNPRARAFARLFSLQPTAKRYISFLDCSFKVSKDKETTARVVLSNEFRLAWCFTLEASFCGASFGELQDSHFNTKHLQQVGRALCESLFHACVSESALRERLLSLVDDRSVSLAAYIENSLLESGLSVEEPEYR